MQIGLSTAAFFGRWETEEAAGQLGRFGADCAEVFLQTYGEYTVSFAKEVKIRLEGLPCTSIHPLGTMFENGMFSRSKRQRQEAFDLFCSILDAGAELGASCYVYHGRHTAQLNPLPFNLAANVDVVGKMCEEAKKRGLQIAWENVFWCQMTTPERAAMIHEALPEVRFTLDIKQAMRAGCDPFAFLPAMGSALMNVHVCDWDEKKKLCLPGEGRFDFPAFLKALLNADYRGPVMAEPYLALIKDDAALVQSIRFLKDTVIRQENDKKSLPFLDESHREE